MTVSRLANGSVIIDMGQAAPGSWQAGRLFTQITVGGLGEASFESFEIGGRRLPAIRLMVDRPLVACMGCQVAGWRLADEPDAPILAGPARTLKDPPDHHVRLTGYRDTWHEGVITVQMSRAVTAEMAQIVADACGLKPEDLYILATRHACLVSSIQVPARGIETAMHRLALEGFDLGCIRHAACTGPIPPLIDDELTAFGRINDALYYGSEVSLYADTDDAYPGAARPPSRQRGIPPFAPFLRANLPRGRLRFPPDPAPYAYASGAARDQPQDRPHVLSRPRGRRSTGTVVFCLTLEETWDAFKTRSCW